MKSYKKCEFNQNSLLQMKPGDTILVICDSTNDFASVRQTCYNTPVRRSREDVSSYKTSIDREGKMVLIQAEK